MSGMGIELLSLSSGYGRLPLWAGVPLTESQERRKSISEVEDLFLAAAVLSLNVIKEVGSQSSTARGNYLA